MPTSRWSRLSSIFMWSRSFLSSAPSGSPRRGAAGRGAGAGGRAPPPRLAPPEGARGGPAVAGKLDEGQGLGDPPRDLRSVDPLHAQAEAHVLRDAAVREERV